MKPVHLTPHPKGQSAMPPCTPASLGTPLTAAHPPRMGAAAPKHHPRPLLAESTPNTGKYSYFSYSPML